MENTPEPSLLDRIGIAFKYCNYFIKTGITIGITFIVWYSLRINRYPQDLSISDGVLFFIISAFFGFFYIVFVFCLVAAGVLASPLIRYIANIFGLLYRKIRGRKIEWPYESIRLDWFSFLYGILAIFFLFILGRYVEYAHLIFPLTSICLYPIYTIMVSSEKNIKLIEKTIKSPINSIKNNVKLNIYELSKHKQKYAFSLIFIAVVPFGLAGASGKLIDLAMLFTKIRTENAIIYVKEPYSTLIPANLTALNLITPKDYAAFEKITILFKGLGKTTVISFEDKGKTKKLDIPNDSIIVESN